MPADKRTGRVAAPAQCRGTSMLEVLITILILSVGMLGLAALQGKAHTSELESYQRGQALVLLQDINSRMEGNMANAASYVTKEAGTGASDAADCTTLGTPAAIDLCEWSKALKGSSEVKGSTRQGAMIDGRGCVTSIGTNLYLLSVVWQGLSATTAPATTCGEGQYDSEATRRAVTMTFRVPDLSGK